MKVHDHREDMGPWSLGSKGPGSALGPHAAMDFDKKIFVQHICTLKMFLENIFELKYEFE